jgi:hypothetical protein
MVPRTVQFIRIRFLFFCTVLASLFLILPDSAWAVQKHGGTEGLVSHQIGHILFITGMLVLFYRLGRSSSSGWGWTQFKFFIGLILLWNMLTFYGHWHREIISPDKFVQTAGKITGFTISSPGDALFYLSRLDHLLLVPAFLCLLGALNTWRRKA